MTKQVFISYSHHDDKPYGPRHLCWVAIFESALAETLQRRMGNRLKLWRDKRRMDENTLFDEEIETELGRSELLISVLSENYMESDFCKKELAWFGREQLRKGGLKVGSRSRVVKVYRAAIDRRRLRERFDDPPELAGYLDGSVGYQIYCVDGDIDRDVLIHPTGMDLVWQKADDLAVALKKMVDEGAMAIPPSAGPSVYLAWVEKDMQATRDALRRKLEDDGYVVLPHQDCPESAADIARIAEADIGRALLSIHLLGGRYGSIPDDGEESALAIQVKLALARESRSFATLAWSPEVADTASGRMGELRSWLGKQSLDPRRAEYLCGELDLLKAQIATRLVEVQSAESRSASGGAASTRQPESAAAALGSVYLVCDAVDRDDTRPLKSALESLGYEVTRPLVEGSPEEMLEEHKRCLVACDIVVIVWGRVREPWLRSKLRDVQQAAGWGRKQDYRAKLLLVGPPDTPAKCDFDPPAGFKLLGGSDVGDLGPLLG